MSIDHRTRSCAALFRVFVSLANAVFNSRVTLQPADGARIAQFNADLFFVGEQPGQMLTLLQDRQVPLPFAPHMH